MRVQTPFLKSIQVALNKTCIFNYGESLNLYSLEPFPEPQKSFDFQNLSISKTKTPLEKPIFNEKLVFGKYHSDHMLEVDWNIKDGWKTPQITHYHNFEINPMNTTLHYALCCFEGMKAFKDDQGRPRLFRPSLNLTRLRRSSLRVGLPDFNGTEFLKCLKEYVKLEKDWIPQKPGYSLYVRPTAISMTDILGVRMAESSKLFVVSSPVGPYYPSGFKPVRIWCEGRVIRAAPKGVGSFKLGSNYGPTIPISKLAEIKGYNQILWLYEDLITEVGTSNVFIYWKNEEGIDELVTPPSDSLILHGITRDSVLNIAVEMDKFKVSERKVTMKQLIKALKEKRVYEMFTSGTAVIIGPVEAFYYENNEYSVPIDPEFNSGRITKEINDKLQAIMYGKIQHPWSVICD